MFGKKSETYSPKWWFDDDLLLVESVKNHLHKQIQDYTADRQIGVSQMFFLFQPGFFLVQNDFGGVGFFFQNNFLEENNVSTQNGLTWTLVGRELPKIFGEFLRRKNATLGVPMSKKHVFFAPKNIFWSLGFN